MNSTKHAHELTYDDAAAILRRVADEVRQGRTTGDVFLSLKEIRVIQNVLVNLAFEEDA